MIVIKALFAVVVGFALTINLVPTRVIVEPAVDIPLTSSSRKLVALVVPAPARREFDTPLITPSGATSSVPTVSSESIAVYPRALFPPAKFSVLGVTVTDSCKLVRLIDPGLILITGMPSTSFGKVTNL